jgi:hypothetical protein
MDDVAQLNWLQLSPAARLDLAGKLDGLYGHASAPAAFEYLAVDKQQALLLLRQRLAGVGLWQHIRQVQNVYGVGGVGVEFTAWPSFLEALRWHRGFTKRLAARRGVTGGFRELRVRRGCLHLLYTGKTDQDRLWNAHFDMYGPLFSPANTVRHLWSEYLNKGTPDWKMARGWLEKR